MTIYEMTKQKLLKDSEKLNKNINEILQNDPNYLILGKAERNKIEELQKRSAVILQKLQKNEFEIAVIGQEDSGKSSLLNALIETDIFPSASGRTTYTSTKLVSGQNDKAEVTIYNYDEFDAIFIKRLESIGIKGFSFDAINLEDFKQEFKDLPAEIQKRAKLDNSYSEIEEILQEQKEIAELLNSQGGKTLTFQGAKLQEFKNYVTGEKDDKSKPRATKEIIISSSQLKKMSNAIIYDVPGFNSPTKLHQEQTDKMLKNADSIIFISDVSSPNLKGDELQTLAKGDDIYGMPLKDKLFIFGNKYDKANNYKEAINNETKFKHDVLSQKAIADEKRVFIGSAGKYLVDNKIGNLDIKFQDWVQSSNVAEFRKAIEEYYRFDRFEVLKKKIEQLQTEMKAVFQKVIKTISLPEKITKQSLVRKIEDEAKRTIRKRLKSNLYQINMDLKNEFQNNQYFSESFTKKVPEYFSEIDENLINQYISEYGDDFDSINRQIRQKHLHNQFLEDFSKLVKEIVDNKTDEVENRVFQAFISAIGNSSEIEQMARKAFVYEKQSGKFDYLFERFGRKMLDLIIYNPIMGSKRECDYETYRDEFLYLDSKYKNDGTVLNIAVSGKPEPLTSKNGITIFKEQFYKALQKLQTSSQDYAKECENSLFPLLENLEQGENSYDDQELFGNRKGNYSGEDVLEEINQDIRNFKMILIEAVIPVLDLESVFIKRVEKEIIVMISKLDSQELNDFILDSLDIYLAKELANVDEKVADYERKKAIIDEIERFLKNSN